MTHEGHMDTEHSTQSAGSEFLRWFGRMIITAVVLAVVSFLTPGFSIRGLWSFLLAAVVISVIDYLVEKMMKVDAAPFGKGLKGFIISAIIIYVAQFLVPGMSVSIIGAILGALVIGIVDAVFPVRVM
ncbi:phage holin family protein [Caproiciproducens sp. CPB-2]|uniref:phage holin family protein n=1 Tax=unclassified Caproiciproducens TaxID=2643836 RepID=UPI003FA47D92